MASMQLTSLKRLQAFVVGKQSDTLTNSTENNRLLIMWLNSVSSLIERYLDRELMIRERTEYFDLEAYKMEYWVKGTPIITLISVYEDSEGEWDGSESEITDCFLGRYKNSINLPVKLDYNQVNGLRAIYTGGLAYHAVNSVFKLTTGNVFSAGKYIIGSSSGAVGIVVDQLTTALTIENYYGVFESGETITEYTNEDGSSPTGISDVIDSLTRESLVQKYPDIVSACETQVRFYWTHTTDFENSGSVKDGSTIRRQNSDVISWPLQEEAKELLNPYRRIVF